MEISEESFYQSAKSKSDLDQKINSLIEFWRVKNIEPHPIVFGINFNSRAQYVVVFNELRFYFKNFVNSLDAAFNLFFLTFHTHHIHKKFGA